ncbi:MAG: hypothetical protein AB7K09_07740 [Planctomycetota bacterium]
MSDQFGQIAVARGLITPQQADEAMQLQKKQLAENPRRFARIGYLLVKAGHLTNAQVLDVLADQGIGILRCEQTQRQYNQNSIDPARNYLSPDSNQPMQHVSASNCKSILVAMDLGRRRAGGPKPVRQVAPQGALKGGNAAPMEASMPTPEVQVAPRGALGQAQSAMAPPSPPKPSRSKPAGGAGAGAGRSTPPASSRGAGAGTVTSLPTPPMPGPSLLDTRMLSTPPSKTPPPPPPPPPALDLPPFPGSEPADLPPLPPHHEEPAAPLHFPASARAMPEAWSPGRPHASTQRFAEAEAEAEAEAMSVFGDAALTDADSDADVSDVDISMGSISKRQSRVEPSDMADEPVVVMPSASQSDGWDTPPPMPFDNVPMPMPGEDIPALPGTRAINAPKPTMQPAGDLESHISLPLPGTWERAPADYESELEIEQAPPVRQVIDSSDNESLGDDAFVSAMAVASPESFPDPSPDADLQFEVEEAPMPDGPALGESQPISLAEFRRRSADAPPPAPATPGMPGSASETDALPLMSDTDLPTSVLRRMDVASMPESDEFASSSREQLESLDSGDEDEEVSYLTGPGAAMPQWGADADGADASVPPLETDAGGLMPMDVHTDEIVGHIRPPQFNPIAVDGGPAMHSPLWDDAPPRAKFHPKVEESSPAPPQHLPFDSEPIARPAFRPSTTDGGAEAGAAALWDSPDDTPPPPPPSLFADAGPLVSLPEPDDQPREKWDDTRALVDRFNLPDAPADADLFDDDEEGGGPLA